MKNFINKYIISIILLVFTTLLITKYYQSSRQIPQNKATTFSRKVIPLNYKDYTLLNTFNKKDIDEYQTAAGAYDIQTIASEVTSTMLTAFSNSTSKSLPLVANWNVGIPEYTNGMDPLYMISRFTYGEHLVPTWKLDPYYNDNIGLSYYETSIKKAAKLGLPLVFILPSPESALTKDDVYFSMDRTQNPNVITVNGTVLPKLSPFGPDSLWNEVGEQWSTTSLIAQLQEWYPNPPLVVFMDEDSSEKLSWSKIASSSRYIKQYPTNTSNEFKRTLVNAKWLEKYRQLHEGFKKGFTKKAWKQNVKFVTRNQLASNMGVTSDWMNAATTTNQHANIWPLTADGLTIDFNLGGDKTDTANAPHRLLNNLPFMIEEAKELNPNFTYQLSIDANQKIDNPQRYRGFTQFALWFLRPSIIRQAQNKTTKDEINPFFQQVVDSVELIHNSDVLADFWKNGKLVSTGNSNYNQNIPTSYQSIPREFLLKTNTTSPIWAFALEKGLAPNREWLVYAQSPENSSIDISLNIPNFKDTLITSSNEGSFNIIYENTKGITEQSNITKNTTVENIVKTLLTNTTSSLQIFKENLKKFSLQQTFGKEFFVSLDGDDSYLGTFEKPFKTLEKARDAVRDYKLLNGIPNGSIVVWIRGGEYTLTKSFELKQEDSGEINKRIVYSSYKNEKVKLIGGTLLESKLFQKISSDDTIFYQLKSEERNSVYIFDLKNIGISNIDVSVLPIEVFKNDHALSIARWPNENDTTSVFPDVNNTKITIYGILDPDVTGDYIQKEDNPLIYKHDGLVNGEQYYIKKVVPTDETSMGYWRIQSEKGLPLWSNYGDGSYIPREFNFKHMYAKSGVPTTISPTSIQSGFAFSKKGINDISFEYNGNEPSEWIGLDNILIKGMFKYAWKSTTNKISEIDTNNKTIHLTTSPQFGIKRGMYPQAYYAYNVPKELDSPTEYYIDKETLKLYVYSNEPITQSTYYLSTNNSSLIYLNNASWIKFAGLTIEISRKNLINIKGGEGNLISHSTLQNSGKILLNITGKNNGIEYSDLSSSGRECINISGGNRTSLVAANNYVNNNNIYNGGRLQWIATGAIRLDGVGNIIEHNNIHDFRHQVIQFKGNNHRIEYNNIYNACKFTEDAGVIYAGRHWGWRGNQINYNFIHDIKNNYRGSDISGIYFDDALSGNYAIGNILYNIEGRGIFINGGRDNIIENNIFSNVSTAYVGSNYGIKNINNIHGSSFNLLERLSEDNVDYTSKIWSDAYPKLTKMPNDWNSIETDGWLCPGGNIFQKNTFDQVTRRVRFATIKTKLNSGNKIYYKIFDKNSSEIDNNILVEKIGIQ